MSEKTRTRLILALLIGSAILAVAGVVLVKMQA
jgi:hypothetical protein